MDDNNLIKIWIKSIRKKIKFLKTCFLEGQLYKGGLTKVQLNTVQIPKIQLL